MYSAFRERMVGPFVVSSEKLKDILPGVPFTEHLRNTTVQGTLDQNEGFVIVGIEGKDIMTLELLARRGLPKKIAPMHHGNREKIPGTRDFVIYAEGHPDYRMFFKSPRTREELVQTGRLIKICSAV